MAATHENDADWFFCMGCDDPWLAESVYYSFFVTLAFRTDLGMARLSSRLIVVSALAAPVATRYSLLRLGLSCTLGDCNCLRQCSSAALQICSGYGR